MNKRYLLLLFLFTSLALKLSAQDRDFTIRGKVLDSATGAPLPQVSVIEMAGRGGTLTDDLGFFTIDITAASRLKFSRLGYNDRTVAAQMIAGDQHITIKISELPIAIPNVDISVQKSVKSDSINNRIQNKEIFEASRKKAFTASIGTQAGIGISPSRIYDNYISPRQRRLRHYRTALEKAEQYTYISSRFTVRVVTGITGLKGQVLTLFMARNRPDYDWLHANSDYELYEFVELRYKSWKATAVGR